MNVYAKRTAFNLASGKIRYLTWSDVQDIIERATPNRALLSPEEELELWQQFARLNAELGPKTRFNSKGIANPAERTRRIALLCQFDLVEFRSQDQQIKETYQDNFGPISLAFVMSRGTKVPAFYYQWTYDAIMEESKRKIGPKTASLLLGSEPHVRFLRAAFGRKIDTFIVNDVLRS